MSEEQKTTEVEPAAEEKKKGPRGPNKMPSKKANLSRRTLRDAARAKKRLLLAKDKEFAKGYFDAKSKRSAQKKVAFRKRHTTKGA